MYVRYAVELYVRYLVGLLFPYCHCLSVTNEFVINASFAHTNLFGKNKGMTLVSKQEGDRKLLNTCS